VNRLKSNSGLPQRLKSGAIWILGLSLLMWGVALLNGLLGGQLNALGIRPRTATGLLGILLSPFIHAGIDHVLVNTIPFVVLGGLVIMLHGSRAFIETSLLIILLSGIGLWVMGRPAHYVGASGLIFGYFGFLVARGWYERSLGSVLVAVLTIVLYGSMLWGVLPTHPHISWAGHLLGLLAGVLAARLRVGEAD